MAQDLYGFSVKKADGSTLSLASFKGKALLIVNVASRCGFTPQYQGLQELYKKLNGRGFEVIGFPCNQFGGQEPGSNEEIQSFCSMNFGVSFPIMAKVDVNGKGADPMWEWLKSESPGFLGTKAIKWNFTKFLIGRDGQVIKRFSPQDKPESLLEEIEKAL